MNERVSRGWRVVLAGGGLVLGAAGCKPKAESAAGADPAKAGMGAAPAEEAAKPARHPLSGRVVSVLKDRGTLLVDHDEIAGYMPHMTMEFKVGAGDLALAKEGAALKATLVEETPGEFRLEGVWWADQAGDAVVRQAAAALREDTSIRGRAAYREVGEKLPDFSLYNQNGEVASAAKWRGKQVMLNFIYSRCPIANMCPASTAKMIDLQRKAKEAGVKNLELVSVTLDPEYDTPGVLKEYADARGIDTSNFSFLTGPEGAIKDLFAQLGILVQMDGPILKHTLSTMLINERGQIVWRSVDKEWTTDEFLARMTR